MIHIGRIKCGWSQKSNAFARKNNYFNKKKKKQLLFYTETQVLFWQVARELLPF